MRGDRDEASVATRRGRRLSARGAAAPPPTVIAGTARTYAFRVGRKPPTLQRGMSTTGEQPSELKRRSFRNFIASVRYSVEGFFAALKHEPSFREDLIFAVLLVPLAIILPVNAVSTALMIASLILILIVELLNSAIEWIIDYLRPERHPLAKRIKDMASAAVFLSYINCIVVWVIMLWPSNAVWRRIAELW
jgi:diacylglycerol kinase (ATP)